MQSPPNPAFLSRQAATFHQKGQLAEADRLYAQILAADPRHFFALNMRGVLRQQQGRSAEALALFNAALQVDPRSVGALSNCGTALLALGRFEEALTRCDQALAINPSHVEALYNGANALQALNRAEQALLRYDKAIALKPGHAVMWNSRGGALMALGRFEDALASYDRALAINPASAEALYDRANVLQALGRQEEALAGYNKAVAITPGDAAMWSNRGSLLMGLNRFEEALTSFKNALAADPGNVSARNNRGLCELTMGQFEEGWRYFEARKDLHEGYLPKAFPQPQWLGGEDIQGKTLFLYSQTGLGDTIQFGRYARMAQAQGAKVIMSVQDGLVRLLKDLGPDIAVVDSRTMPEHFDYHNELMSMPLAFRTRVETVPAHGPYLRADPERSETWKSRIGTEGFKIGIGWQGEKKRTIDAGRSFSVACFEPLAKIPNVRLISLQKKDGVEQLSHLPAGMTVETLGDDFDAGPDAFLDTAAVMENLDLIITTDTSLAHLAGALARPVWVALKFSAEWRWMAERPDSPWYPGMTLFRQSSPGDWPGLFARMERQLAVEAGRRR